jgi:transcriptional repressor NrdR
MQCPFCGDIDGQVLESRVVENGMALRRRRMCHNCKKRFTTYERIHKKILWVIKKDGKREPFDREKISRGVLRAIRKRPVSLDQVEEVATQVEREALRKGKTEVSSKVIGRAVLRRLKKLDKVAWLRFASVYLEFEDLDDFETAIEKSDTVSK